MIPWLVTRIIPDTHANDGEGCETYGKGSGSGYGGGSSSCETLCFGRGKLSDGGGEGGDVSIGGYGCGQGDGFGMGHSIRQDAEGAGFITGWEYIIWNIHTINIDLTRGPIYTTRVGWSDYLPPLPLVRVLEVSWLYKVFSVVPIANTQ